MRILIEHEGKYYEHINKGKRPKGNDCIGCAFAGQWDALCCHSESSPICYSLPGGSEVWWQFKEVK